MITQMKKTIGIVIQCYNEELNIEIFFKLILNPIPKYLDNLLL
jgi:hypothetical protein